MQPSLFDLWSADSTVRLAQERIEITDGATKAAYLMSRVIKGAKVTKSLQKTMEVLDLPVFNTQIQQRVIYPLAATQGLTAFELEPQGEAAQDFRRLVDEIKEMFSGTSKIQKPRKHGNKKTVNKENMETL